MMRSFLALAASALAGLAAVVASVDRDADGGLLLALAAVFAPDRWTPRP